MTITIYDKVGLIYHHQMNVNRVACTRDGTIHIYYDWDGISFARLDIEQEHYSWFEIGDK